MMSQAPAGPQRPPPPPESGRGPASAGVPVSLPGPESATPPSGARPPSSHPSAASHAAVTSQIPSRSSRIFSSAGRFLATPTLTSHRTRGRVKDVASAAPDRADAVPASRQARRIVHLASRLRKERHRCRAPRGARRGGAPVARGRGPRQSGFHRRPVAGESSRPGTALPRRHPPRSEASGNRTMAIASSHATGIGAPRLRRSSNFRKMPTMRATRATPSAAVRTPRSTGVSIGIPSARCPGSTAGSAPRAQRTSDTSATS